MNRNWLALALCTITVAAQAELLDGAVGEPSVLAHRSMLGGLDAGASLELQLTDGAVLAIARDGSGIRRATLALTSHADGVELHGWTAEFDLTAHSGVIRDVADAAVLDTYFAVELARGAQSVAMARKSGRIEGGIDVSSPLEPAPDGAAWERAATMLADARATAGWAYLGAVMNSEVLGMLAPKQFDVFIGDSGYFKHGAAAGKNGMSFGSCLGACGAAGGCGVVAGGMVVTGIGAVGGSIGIAAGAGAACGSAAAICGGCVGTGLYIIWNDWF
ncbi:MAG: hypothetical protein AAGE01_12845 [Pseudomonadota bacterium]